MSDHSIFKKKQEEIKRTAPKLDPFEVALWQEVDIKGYRSQHNSIQLTVFMLKNVLANKNTAVAAECLGDIERVADKMIRRIEGIDLEKIQSDPKKTVPLEIVREIVEEVPRFLRKAILRSREAVAQGELSDQTLRELEEGFAAVYALGDKMKADEGYARYRHFVAADGERMRI